MSAALLQRWIAEEREWTELTFELLDARIDADGNEPHPVTGAEVDRALQKRMWARGTRMMTPAEIHAARSYRANANKKASR
jgi:hypothetical protein